MVKNKKFDTIIIGSGIGGLVSGCYLAKSGLRVLIVEQHDKPGGYCTSFKRKGYRFDVGVHYLGGLKNGVLKKILDELEIDFKMTQIDPTDKIIMPDQVIYIRASLEDTVMEFKNKFPHEKKSIERFFYFITQEKLLSIYQKIKHLTFGDVLNCFFSDFKLKAILSLLLGNIGLTANCASGFASVVLFREYILDSGYYPIGGIQTFPDELAKKIKSLNGELVFNKKVVKIIIGKHLNKILLDTGEELFSKIIISNSDATTMFKKIIDIKTKEYALVDRLKPSPSMFLLYLGLNINLKKILYENANIWYFTSYDINTIYSYQSTNLVKNKIEGLTCSFPSLHDPSLSGENKSTATISILAPFKNKNFWDKNKIEVGEKLIKKTEEIIPDLKKYIELKIHATPYDFYKYTSNREGAFVGWDSTLKQTKIPFMPIKTSIRGLYIVGHWSTVGYSGQGGIPNVAFSGRKGADLILREISKKFIN